MRKYKVDLGEDALGNLTRIENEIAKLPARLEAAKTRKEETIAQLETAKEEVTKPFAQEAELAEKLERLSALNALLNMDEKGDNAIGLDDTADIDTIGEQENSSQETSGHDVQKCRNDN